MTYADFCRQYHITIWAAQRVDKLPRWRLVLRHHDGRHTQMTLTVRSAARPAAPAVLRALVQEARRFEATNDLSAWDNQRRLMRFLGPELYREALDITE